MSSRRRALHTFRALLSHDNPLGLPRSSATPPNLSARMSRNLPQKRRIRSVSKVIAVSSAKGGVGKSTIAANLALAFARQGKRTGILDTDVFGPSVPTIFNLDNAPEPALTEAGQLVPLTNYGVRTMSMGYLMPPGDDSVVAWRGLMLQKALQQLLHEVDWGGLDVLVLDMPPGTGDTQLTVAQQIVVDGAVVVSTPQGLALKDSVKGITMFRKMDVPVLGMVQNMSGYACPKCGEVSDLFGADGVRRECDRLGLELLADIPLDLSICSDADAGRPSVVAQPDGLSAGIFTTLARKVGELVGI